MDLKFSPEEEAFRVEVRGWLEANLPQEWRWHGIGGFQPDELAIVRRLWQRRLYEAGWMKLTWPLEVGGRGGTPVMEHILQEELMRAGAPVPMGLLGVSLLVPMLQVYGTTWQKDTYIEAVLSGDLLFCQGFSEPNAGSDLASLTTRAERRGGGWWVNGQKTWSSFATQADRCFLLARTSPEVRPQEGISLFLLDMKQKGVEVRPIRQLTGGGDFAEVFYTDAVVDDRDLVGRPGEGWRIAMSAFGFERGSMAAVAAGADHTMSALLELTRSQQLGGDPLVRQRVGQAHIEAEIFRLLILRSLSRAQKDAQPGPEASLLKLYWTEMDKRIQDAALAMHGVRGAIAAGSPTALAGGRWQQAWLWAQAGTIYGGSSEIQRNVLAERVLGLPRSR